MTIFHAHDLDAFVTEVDRLGGVGDSQAAAFLAQCKFKFATPVNPRLDPFSAEYFQQQVALYRELSGRELDQAEGELTPLDVDVHVAGCNPYNSPDARFIAKHTRAIHTCVMLANLPPGAAVLDMGCGWGLSSEALAFCGAKVMAVDINPQFVELVQRRAERLGLPTQAVCSEFDTFTTTQRYDLILFYECLHHSVKPWETLGHLSQFVKEGGKIVFAGEPVNGVWWPNWGLRLDPTSIYVMRKFGWWESGWTREFITRCFARNGFDLTLYPHIGLNNGLIGVAVRSGVTLQTPVDRTVMDPFWRPDKRLITWIEQTRYWPLLAQTRLLWRRLKKVRGIL